MFGIYKFIIKPPNCRPVALLNMCYFSELHGGFILKRNGVLKFNPEILRCTYNYSTLIPKNEFIISTTTDTSKSTNIPFTSYKTVPRHKIEMVRQISRNFYNGIHKEVLKHDGKPFVLIYKMKNTKIIKQVPIAFICMTILIVIFAICFVFIGTKNKNEDERFLLKMAPLICGAWFIFSGILIYIFHSRLIISLYRNKSGVENTYIAIKPHLGFWQKEFHFKQEEVRGKRNDLIFSVRNHKFSVDKDNFVSPVYCDELFGVESISPIMQNMSKDRKNIEHFRKRMKKMQSSQKPE